MSARAAVRVQLDGKDLTDRIQPRLQSLNLSEASGEEADQLDLVITDHDGQVAIPRKGAVLEVWLGWETGRAPPGAPEGLVYKGRFKVDEVEHSGVPDIITIRARSADFTESFRQRRQKSWRSTTLGAVLQEIAGRHQLTPRIDAALAARPIAVLEQSRESDSALLQRLGRQYDARATVKDGKLLFTPAGVASSASGAALPGLTLTRQSGDRHRWRSADRAGYSGVQASWHDTRGAQRRTVTVGDDGAKVKKLRKIYGSEAAARRAAQAEAGRVKRAGAEFSLDLAWGRPDVFPGRPVTVTGFKPEIDSSNWLVKQARHSFSDSAGLLSMLDMELSS